MELKEKCIILNLYVENESQLLSTKRVIRTVKALSWPHILDMTQQVLAHIAVSCFYIIIAVKVIPY